MRKADPTPGQSSRSITAAPASASRASAARQISVKKMSTPAEAVSWGKVDPDRLPDAVVCYTDSTIAMPLLAAYALSRHEAREPKRLFKRRQESLDRLIAEYERSLRNETMQERARHGEEHQPTLERSR